jgi:hypothetical protein
MDDDNWIINWAGDKAPVLHQLNHFIGELKEIAISDLKSPDRSKDMNSNEKRVENNLNYSEKYRYRLDDVDLPWQSLSISRCLWGCG